MKFIDVYTKCGYVAQHLGLKLFEYGVFYERKPWGLRLWSNLNLKHGKGFLLQIAFHAAENIPCYNHVGIIL